VAIAGGRHQCPAEGNRADLVVSRRQARQWMHHGHILDHHTAGMMAHFEVKRAYSVGVRGSRV
jgi:FtsP/CotA-like multicopper oxidase with cupredoxin domain